MKKFTVKGFLTECSEGCIAFGTLCEGLGSHTEAVEEAEYLLENASNIVGVWVENPYGEYVWGDCPETYSRFRREVM